MDGEHDREWNNASNGVHFHYFGDYTLGMVMFQPEDFFFHRLSERPETKYQLKRQLNTAMIRPHWGDL